MVPFVVGLVGNLTAIIGWFGFHSIIAVLVGTLLYLIETAMEWRDLNLNAKLTDVLVFALGVGIGLFVKSVPWYICGMIALNIYGLFCLGFGLVAKIIFFK